MAKHIVTACPNEVELDDAPFPREWVLEGNPRARAKQIARSDDASMQVIVWSCTRGRFRWQYDVDEMVQILSGEVVVTDHNGVERRLGSGDTAFFPAGSWSVWHVTKDVRKVAVCRNVMPKMVTFGLRAWGWGARRAQAWLAPNAVAPAFSAGNLGVAAR
jgi:uncharacterized protein